MVVSCLYLIPHLISSAVFLPTTSDLEIKGNCTISGNHAMRGGGIHATSSTVAVYQPGTLLISSNRAEMEVDFI